jgi:hypothetical protein
MNGPMRREHLTRSSKHTIFIVSCLFSDTYMVFGTESAYQRGGCSALPHPGLGWSQKDFSRTRPERAPTDNFVKVMYFKIV